MAIHAIMPNTVSAVSLAKTRLDHHLPTYLRHSTFSSPLGLKLSVNASGRSIDTGSIETEPGA
jgi:hypothetical protein